MRPIRYDRIYRRRRRLNPFIQMTSKYAFAQKR